MFAADTVILIPTLHPQGSLVSYASQLMNLGPVHLVIIDDGSGDDYSPCFAALTHMGCHVIRYEPNRGKGHALKVGIRYIEEHLPDIACIVTADSDGQHLPMDVVRVAEASASHPNALILGERDLHHETVPRKSSLGNGFASACFALLFGQHITDTQTGLRAFRRPIFNTLLALPGEHYEYEMRVLATCARSGVPLVPLAIETVYEQGNSGTHYRPLLDSLRVALSLLATFLRFTASSMACAVVDQAVAWTLMSALTSVLPGQDFLRIFTATVVARVISMLLNYGANRRLVFRETAGRRSVVRYFILGLTIMSLSAMGVFALHSALLVDERIAKVVVDLCLFVLSYRVQQSWVFDTSQENNAQEV